MYFESLSGEAHCPYRKTSDEKMRANKLEGMLGGG